MELSKEEFLNGVVYRRNPELLKVFQDVDLIENVGSGVKRILESYDESCFEFMEHFLRVSIKFKKNTYDYSDNGKINDKINDKINLILNILKSNSYATILELVKETNISSATISRYLKILQERKIVERVGSNKTGYWKILKQ